MQMEQSLFKSASTIINGKLQQLLNNDFSSHGEPIRLLPPRPAKQRLSFLNNTISNSLQVLIQLMPVNNDGYPVNVRGTVKKLDSERYLIQNQNVSYVVNFNQIRYIANF